MNESKNLIFIVIMYTTFLEIYREQISSRRVDNLYTFELKH